MKLNKRNVIANYCVKLNKLLLVILSGVFLSACQLTDHYLFETAEVKGNSNYSSYYLLLKTLTESELQEEIVQQRAQKSQGNTDAEIKLILLHSLPNSPSHNAYTAKSLLNDLLKQDSSYQLNSADQALISLLKDQLNQQLYIFQKLINQELTHDEQLASEHLKEKKQLQKIAALELKVKQLTTKIIQLKKIEQTISDHGQ